MLRGIILFTVLLSVVQGLGWFQSTNPGNYSLLCDDTKSFRCNCPPDDKTSVFNCSLRKITDLPDDVKFPNSITDVSFSRNLLDHVPNTAFTEGIKVELLDLSHNRIRTVSGSAFANLDSLTTLDLSHNAIWSLSFETFNGLRYLEKLNLAYNRISDIYPDIFKPCTKLRELSLRFNAISSLRVDSFSYIPELEILDLSSSGLSSLPEKVFKDNLKLIELMLNTNNFHEVPSEGLKSAENLKQLDLSENPIEKIEENAFNGLNKLEILIITHMRKLVSLEPHSLAGLDKLRDLILTDNLKLSKISESSFKKKPQEKGDKSTEETNEDEDESEQLLSMEKLVLRHNELRFVPEGLLDWSQLKEVDLRENPWQCDCHLKWIAEKVISDSAKNNAKCEGPSRQAGKSLSSLSKTDFTCSYMTAEATVVLSVLVVAAFVLALGGVTYILYRRSSISCRRKTAQPRYARVVSDREKVDLEWDHTAEPESKA